MLLPPAIAALIGDGQCHRIDAGCTRATVLKVTRQGQPTIFLKSCRVTPCDDLASEAKRLEWLQGKLSVPDVISFLATDGWEYLVTTGLPGINGVEAAHRNPAAVVRSLAEALAYWHSQSIWECPFNETRHPRTEEAHERLKNGCVDEADFDEERRGMTAAQVWHELEKYPEFSETLVLTHGDPCLPNVIFEGDHVVGFVDCGRVGKADAHQDLALASRSIASNLGTAWMKAFFDAYGLGAPDDGKLRFYRLLDEFF